MKESVDRVIVTDYESIVGLEFDCVFIVGANSRLAKIEREDVESAWVAITRGRKFCCVTRSAPDLIFSRDEFSEFRK